MAEKECRLRNDVVERRRRLLRRPPGRDGTNTREDKQQTFNIKILLAARRGIDRRWTRTTSSAFTLWSSIFTLQSPPGTRTDADDAPKQPREMRLVGEPAIKGNL